MVLNVLNSVGTDGFFGHQDTQNSMLSKIGQTITPAFAPMGITRDNWPAAVGIFTGILAKEAVVGTLDSMYSAIASDENANIEREDDFDLMGGIQEAFVSIPENLMGVKGSLTDPLGMNVGDLNDLEKMADEYEMAVDTFSVMARLFPSTSAVIAYLLLILLYTPCVAALGAIYRETNIRWTLFVAGWTFLLGYSVATVYYQISLITVQPVASLSWIGAVFLVLSAVFAVMKRVGAGVTAPLVAMTAGNGVADAD